MESLRPTRCGTRLSPDPRRVIAKSFVPGEQQLFDGTSRIDAVLRRIIALPDAVVDTTLRNVRDQFGSRHRDLDGVFDRSMEVMAPRLEQIGHPAAALGTDRRRLCAAYFTHEYSIEAAALGNPSIVAAPDQGGLGVGELRFVMSLRAIGEGHLSSIEFRTGVVSTDASIRLEDPSPFAVTGRRSPHRLHKGPFAEKLRSLGFANDIEARVLSHLPERFSIDELEAAITTLDDDVERSISGETTRLIHWLAASNYRVEFPATTALSERVLFPSSPTESSGMEDARFVRFTDDDGSVRYLATYTAYDGHQILPQLLETPDFADWQVSTLGGDAACNKGIALFPRRIGGHYMALGRQDNVNNFLMASDDLRVWDDAAVLQEPAQPWELMQLGNCGSPIETEAGWLVITHGVGPMRQYTLGALLLDLDDPVRVIGHLDEPLLIPQSDEREGYVPNVVYSCGSLVHAGTLVIPYGFADVGASLATIPLADLLERLTAPTPVRSSTPRRVAAS